MAEIDLKRFTRSALQANLWEFGNLYTPKGFADAIEVSARKVSNRGGGRIHFPSELFPVGVPDANLVPGGTDEGAAAILTAQHSNVMFYGAAGKTKLVPLSNRIEVFAINGAAGLCFEGIYFDDSANGVLLGQVKPGGTKVPGSGVAGLGNAANCAIRQYAGADLTVEDCEFAGFRVAVNYLGNEQDHSQLVGTIRFRRNRIHDNGTALMTMQPEHVICDGNEYWNSVDSINSDGTRDPGHLVYIPNTDAAHPYTVGVRNNRAWNCKASPIKMRKGLRQVATGNVMHQVHGGIESHRSLSTTIVGNTVGLAAVHESDINSAGILIVGCSRGGTVADNTVDKSGTSVYGIRLTPPHYEPPAESDDNDGSGLAPLRNVNVRGNTIIDDLAGDGTNPAKEAFIQVRNMIGGEVRENKAIITANVALNGAVFKAIDCTGTTFWDNTRDASEAGNPSGSDRLVSIDSDCEDCTVGFRRENVGYGIEPTNFSIVDAGTRTRVVRLDEAASSVRTTDFTVPNHLRRFINNKASTDLTVTLPAPGLHNKGDRLFFLNWRPFAVKSASSNVIRLGANSTTNMILPPGYGRRAELESNGVDAWVVVDAGDGDGSVFTDGAGATGMGIGYAQGMNVGGTVTQITSKGTGVTNNRTSVEITMHNASLAAGASVSFTFTNKNIEANDQLLITHKSGGNLGDYRFVHRCGAGSASIMIINTTGGDLSDAIVLQVGIFKGSIN